MRHKILIGMMVMSVFLLMGCGRANNPNGDTITENGGNPVQEDPIDGDGPITDGAVNDDDTDNNVGDGVISDIGDGVGDAMDGVGEGVDDVMDGAGNAVKDVTDGAGNTVRNMTE